MGMIEDILALHTQLTGRRVEPWGPLKPVTDTLGLTSPSAGGARDAVGETMGSPGGGVLEDLGTGGGAALPVSPEEEDLYTKYGLADQIPFIATLDEEERGALNKKLIESGPPVAPESKNYNIDALVKEFPELEGIIRAAPPGAIANIISSAVSRRNAKPTKEPWAADREAAVRSMPELAPYIDSMSDSDVSSAMREAFEGQQKAGPDGISYEDVEGAPKIKIMQDAAFQRSGLKSGDTVCVRIP